MNPRHIDMDDMSDFAVGYMQELLRREREEAERQALLSADYGPKDKAEGVVLVMPQGRPEQGWPARRCSPEVQPHIVDRLREDYDDQTESADEQVALWLLKGLIVVCTTLLCAWVIAGGLNA